MRSNTLANAVTPGRSSARWSEPPAKQPVGVTALSKTHRARGISPRQSGPEEARRGEDNVRMNHREERAELRGAVYRGDAGSLVGILKREAGRETALQVLG